MLYFRTMQGAAGQGSPSSIAAQFHGFEAATYLPRIARGEEAAARLRSEGVEAVAARRPPGGFPETRSGARRLAEAPPAGAVKTPGASPGGYLNPLN